METKVNLDRGQHQGGVQAVGVEGGVAQEVNQEEVVRDPGLTVAPFLRLEHLWTILESRTSASYGT